MYVQTDVTLLRQQRLAAVDADPHPHRQLLERRLRFGGRRERAGRGWEGYEERIALRIDLDALVGPERLTQDTAMLRQHPRVLVGAQVVQQLRRTLDVGEEERDGARWQAAHLRRGSRFFRPNASGTGARSCASHDP